MSGSGDVKNVGAGSKRKAEDLAPLAPKRIKALDQDVVNKIAAGEIIVAPVHALKELIENAVDAGSTSLEITVKDGGLKLLQITDNGHGIHRDDLPILCERFTTSKLKSFEDLATVATYGFRGEALASISHIAHLTITTRTADSSCAWRARYASGQLVSAKPGQTPDPKPTAGRNGTQITVEDLFYNVPSRQRAFRSPSEEYAKILDVVGRYAVHCSGVAFSCKKHGETMTSISTPANTSTIDSIRQIYGSAIANELISYEASDKTWGFQASGWATNANYHVKKSTILIFINHRSVESSAIKKTLEQTYAAYLPKGGHPFVYLNLHIDPARVDVNVHPTKREVNFLNQEEVIESICNIIRDKLAQVDASRTFTTQTLLPISSKHAGTPQSKLTQARSVAAPTPRLSESNMVRTDPHSRKITSMLPALHSHKTLGGDGEGTARSEYNSPSRERVECRLASVKALRSAVRDEMHIGLTETFAALTYIGLVDPIRRLAAIQSGVKLLLVDYGLLSREYFYQLGLSDFANFGSLKFEPPLDVNALIKLGVETERLRKGDRANDDLRPVNVATSITAHLISKRAMLLEYFNFKISSEGELLSLPLLLKEYTPHLAKLPRFLMRLGPCVDWEDEQECFKGFLMELARFYAVEQLPPDCSPEARTTEDDVEMSDAEALGGRVTLDRASPNEDQGMQKRRLEIERVLEHVLFPAFRARLVATQDLLKGVVEVADLKGLYRVFERC